MRQYFQRVLTRGVCRTLLPWVTLSICLLSIGSGAAPQNPNPPEIQAHEGQEAQPTFQLHVERNLVTVKVVVRDRNDRPVGNLHQEDFRLFDGGKPQDILGFTVEAGNPKPAPEAVLPTSAPMEKTTEVPPAPWKIVAQRFVILYFDDFHLEPEGISLTRNSAWRYVNTTLRPQDRVAILTATGKDQLDFTEDREKLHDALFRLAPKPRVPITCPEIGSYEALLVTQQNPDALAIVHQEAVQCDCAENDPTIDPMKEHSALHIETFDPKPLDPCLPTAKERAEREAAQIWDLANMQSQYSLQGIEISVRRLAAMPGQRSLVLVSPGFLTQVQASEIDDITNRALQQDVVISAIDAAGLAPRNMHNFIPGRPDLETRKTTIENFGTIAAQDVMAGLSAATGGVFFHNSNDFDDGFQQAAAVPEVYYVLTFSPPNVMLDGKFHSLRVTLNTPGTFTVQARRGYFASASGLAGQASSLDELKKVVFSQEEIHGLPADVKAQVAPESGSKSKLTVIIHVDVRSLQFRRDADRHVDKLIFHATLFDRDGKYIGAKEASLDLHLKDATLEKFIQSGINATTSFEVAPGTYRVREVVRDTESKEMSALNCVVEVPGPPSPQGAEKP
jgi:VWFA-related protein